MTLSLMPPAHIDAFSKLHHDVDPFPYDEVEQIVCDELRVRISAAFDHFEQKPIAAASLGQVHRAQLRDGREVAVKVRRADIRRMIREDLEVLDELAGAIDRYTKFGGRYPLRDIVAQFRPEIYQQLDYRREAQYLVTLADALSDHDQIAAPAPVPDLISNRVLTMDHLDGVAALIIGAALMVRVESEPTLFDYPAVAAVLFLFAAAIGFGLVIRIQIPGSRDWKRDNKR